MAPTRKTPWFQKQIPLTASEIYTDLLRMSESPVVGTAMPATAASSRSKKRTRAHDDVVILTEKRSRKGPGFYNNFADSAPMELEVAGDCTKTEVKRRTLKVKRSATQMACSGAMQGTAGADGGHNPQADVDIPSTPMEDALLIEHFYSSASSQAGGSNNSSPSAERSVKDEDQLLQQPIAAEELNDAALTESTGDGAVTFSVWTALIHVVWSAQMEAPVVEKVKPSPEKTAKKPAAKAAAVKKVTTKKPTVTEPARRSVRVAASPRANRYEMQ